MHPSTFVDDASSFWMAKTDRERETGRVGDGTALGRVEARLGDSFCYVASGHACVAESFAGSSPRTAVELRVLRVLLPRRIFHLAWRGWARVAAARADGGGRGPRRSGGVTCNQLGQWHTRCEQHVRRAVVRVHFAFEHAVPLTDLRLGPRASASAWSREVSTSSVDNEGSALAANDWRFVSSKACNESVSVGCFC